MTEKTQNEHNGGTASHVKTGMQVGISHLHCPQRNTSDSPGIRDKA